MKTHKSIALRFWLEVVLTSYISLTLVLLVLCLSNELVIYIDGKNVVINFDETFEVVLRVYMIVWFIMDMDWLEWKWVELYGSRSSEGKKMIGCGWKNIWWHTRVRGLILKHRLRGQSPMKVQEAVMGNTKMLGSIKSV